MIHSHRQPDDDYDDYDDGDDDDDDYNYDDNISRSTTVANRNSP